MSSFEMLLIIRSKYKMSCFISSYNMTSHWERVIDLRADKILYRIEEHFFKS